tara:strand:+ start:219 stop:593 length:375 start_codon:yes stop_codon:yes gene_type:complete
MAKYIKFNLTAPVAAETGSELLIEVADVLRYITSSATTTTVFLKNPLNATRSWVITHADTGIAPSGVLDAIASALTANPGGVVSTVGSPVSIAQAPLAQSGLQGRQPITIAQVNITYTSATYVA